MKSMLCKKIALLFGFLVHFFRLFQHESATIAIQQECAAELELASAASWIKAISSSQTVDQNSTA
jgi:hypothetical protein